MLSLRMIQAKLDPTNKESEKICPNQFKLSLNKVNNSSRKHSQRYSNIQDKEQIDPSTMNTTQKANENTVYHRMSKESSDTLNYSKIQQNVPFKNLFTDD